MMKVEITNGWDSDDVLASREVRTEKRAEWWIGRLGPLYANAKPAPYWNFCSVREGVRVVDFGSHWVFARITGD